MRLLFGWCLPLVLAAMSAAVVSAEEIAEWEFKGPEAGWTPNDQTELSVADGVLQVRSKGVDPFFSTAVAGRAGQHRILI
ncbi:MAG: hypothetical protein RLZZ458_1413, partial [Planctomycetota bacterium]